jgi:hypothetical protein
MPWVISGMLLLALAAPAHAAAATDIRCAGELTGVTVRNVTVPAGAACTLRRSTVMGSVTAPAGAYFHAAHTDILGSVTGRGAQTLFLDQGTAVYGRVRADGAAQVFVFSSRIRGHVQIDRATDRVYLCGSVIERGTVTVSRSGRDIQLGGPGCGGNTVRRGGMTVTWNKTDVQLAVIGNRFPKGNLIVSGNTGPSAKVVRRNSGGRHIACQANAGSFRASQNRRFKTGGCRR